jgi:hypothetical protein
MKRPIAAALLVLMLLVLGHSVFAMYKGRFQESTVMLPVLIVCYVFFVARRKPEEERQERPDDEAEDLEGPSDREGKEG